MLELRQWKTKLVRKQSMVERLSKSTQTRINQLIPQKAHQLLTDSIKQMVEITLTGNQYLPSSSNDTNLSLKKKEEKIRALLLKYKRIAAVEGAGTGAGGIFLGLADFPLLLAIKMRFLFEVGSVYGFDVKEYNERLFVLSVFQLAFSSEAQKKETLHVIETWEDEQSLRKEIDWRKWQQEYRDYIDLVKMLQLVPGIGAVVGAYANYHLLDHLGETAIQCYRLRVLE